MIFPHIIKWNAQLCSPMLKTKILGGFQKFVADSIGKIIAFCVIFRGVFNLRSMYKENGTQ